MDRERRREGTATCLFYLNIFLTVVKIDFFSDGDGDVGRAATYLLITR